jgi:hypothetical protein
VDVDVDGHGVRVKDDGARRIVGGEPVESIDTYPWLVSLQINRGWWIMDTLLGSAPSFSHSCGGSLIAPNLLLTGIYIG